MHCAGLTSEALLIISSTDGISCGRLAFLDLRIGRGLRKITSTAVLIRRFRRIMCRCWYSLSWQHAADRASAADSLAHCCRPVSAVSALLSPRVGRHDFQFRPCRAAWRTTMRRRHYRRREGWRVVSCPVFITVLTVAFDRSCADHERMIVVHHCFSRLSLRLDESWVTVLAETYLTVLFLALLWFPFMVFVYLPTFVFLVVTSSSHKTAVRDVHWAYIQLWSCIGGWQTTGEGLFSILGGICNDSRNETCWVFMEAAELTWPLTAMTISVFLHCQ